MKLSRSAAMSICAMLALAAAHVRAADPPAKNGTIGVSVMTLSNPFFKIIGDTIKREGEKNGYEVIVVSGEDPATQHRQVKDFITRRCAAIVLCPTDSRAIGAAIREANAANIPVFTADLGTLDKGAKVVSHIATDNLEGGKQAGAAMIEAIGATGGKILVLDYKPAESCLLRVQGFKAVIDEWNVKHPDTKIEIVMEQPCEGKTDVGFKSTQARSRRIRISPRSSRSMIPRHWARAGRWKKPTSPTG